MLGMICALNAGDRGRSPLRGYTQNIHFRRGGVPSPPVCFSTVQRAHGAGRPVCDPYRGSAAMVVVRASCTLAYRQNFNHFDFTLRCLRNCAQNLRVSSFAGELLGSIGLFAPRRCFRTAVYNFSPLGFSFRYASLQNSVSKILNRQLAPAIRRPARSENTYSAAMVDSHANSLYTGSPEDKSDSIKLNPFTSN